MSLVAIPTTKLCAVLIALASPPVYFSIETWESAISRRLSSLVGKASLKRFDGANYTRPSQSVDGDLLSHNPDRSDDTVVRIPHHSCRHHLCAQNPLARRQTFGVQARRNPLFPISILKETKFLFRDYTCATSTAVRHDPISRDLTRPLHFGTDTQSIEARQNVP